MSKSEIKSEIDKFTEKIANELEKGKDVVIKATDKGIKIQTLQVNTIK